MKNLKKLSALLLAFALLAGFISPIAVHADETFTLQIQGQEGHSYEVYQIFKGDIQMLDSKRVLTNVQWGDSVDSAYTDGKDAYDIAKALTDENIQENLREYDDHLTGAFQTLTPGSYSAQVPGGYYLIRDYNVPNGDTYTLYMVRLVSNETLCPKVNKPSFVKKIMDVNDSTEDQLGDAVYDPSDSRWQDSADYDIGDLVPFRLSATVDHYIDDYHVYKLSFVDTMSQGLDVDQSTIVVKVNDTVLDASNYNVSTSGDVNTGTNLTVTIPDLKGKAVGGDNVHVFYQARLLDGVGFGSNTENLNVAHIEYSNDPNWTPENGQTNDDTPTTESNEDKVRIFVFQTLFNKVDENHNPLEGAEFKFEKYNKATDAWEELTISTSGNQHTAKGLDDGYYRLTETASPAGYNTLDEPVYFEIEATHEADSVDPQLTSLVAYEMEMDDNGVLVHVQENGANKVFGGADAGSGTICANIINKAGVELPETGGMGTTLLYVMGSLLAVGAAVILVTRKAVSSK